jgi:apolipoprotein N-acyltransferase
MRLIRANHGLLFAILTGFLILSSFPAINYDSVVWFAFVPLLYVLESASLRRAFTLSYVTGLVYFAGITYWIWSVAEFNLIDFVLLAGYFPHYVSLWGLSVVVVRRRTGLPLALVAPPLWITLELVRSHFFFLSAPWMLIGHSQFEHPMLLQITSWTGAYGLSFLIMVVNAALTETALAAHLRGRSLSMAQLPLRSLVGCGVLMLATLCYGRIVLSQAIEGNTVRIALIQGNIEQNHKWEGHAKDDILQTYGRLTRQAALFGPSLIIWPETAVPGDVRHHPELRKAVHDLALSIDVPLLVGSAENAKFSDKKLRGKYYNGMYLITPEHGITSEYRKVLLVPFGEYVPAKEWIRWPEAIASTMGDLTPGHERTIFRLGSLAFGTTICWETLFPDLFREFVQQGAQFMISSTNEAWFGDTAAPHQVLAMTVFRASENRVAIARAANTGLSAFIDSYGRIVDRLRDENGNELFVEGVLWGDVPLANRGTFYTRYGDVFAAAQVTISASFAFGFLPSWGALLVSIRRRQRSFS